MKNYVFFAKSYNFAVICAYVQINRPREVGRREK